MFESPQGFVFRHPLQTDGEQVAYTPSARYGRLNFYYYWLYYTLILPQLLRWLGARPSARAVLALVAGAFEGPVTISERARPRETLLEALRATAGAWKGLVDAEDLKRRIYEDRLLSTRPEPRL